MVAQWRSKVLHNAWSILQYFWPALSDDWYWNPNFGLFKTGRFIQVLLYVYAISTIIGWCYKQNGSRRATKPDQVHVKHKPVCSATETSYNTEMLNV